MTASGPSNTAPGFAGALPASSGSVATVAAAPLAERLVRLLCVVGLMKAAGTAVVQFGAPILWVWARTGSFSFSLHSLLSPDSWLIVFYGLAELASIVFLTAGAAGELVRRPRARRFLLLYVAAWAVSWALGVAVMYAARYQAMSRFGSPVLGMDWAALAQGAGQFLSEAAYPLLLLVTLRWPETRRATTGGRGFLPVLPLEDEGRPSAASTVEPPKTNEPRRRKATKEN